MVLISGYGMSETAPTVAVARAPAGDADEEAQIAAMTASGIPIPLVSARIVDSQMRELPHDGKAQGELVLRAPWLTTCYMGDAAASEALWRGGWMHTQDVATIDPDGTIIIRDRLKDVIKTGGEWLSSLTYTPEDIEFLGRVRAFLKAQLPVEIRDKLLNGYTADPDDVHDGARIGGNVAVELPAVLDYATAALCAEALGALDKLLAMTIEYSRTRVQFGVPIGRFQALQHRMADMLTHVEQAS